MKLTKTQQTVLEELKAALDTMKKHSTFESYFENEVKAKYYEYYVFGEDEMNAHKNRYEQALQNIVRLKANTKTLEKLSALGLIEVLTYDKGYFQRDLIKVLN